MTGLSWVAGQCPAKCRARLVRADPFARAPFLSCGPAAGPRMALKFAEPMATAARGFDFRLEERE
jgi:hypothetical protein